MPSKIFLQLCLELISTQIGFSNYKKYINNKNTEGEKLKSSGQNKKWQFSGQYF